MEHHRQPNKTSILYPHRDIAFRAFKQVLLRNKFSRVRATSDPTPLIIRAPECFLLQCPNGIIFKIVKYLKLKDIATLVRTCRSLQNLLEIPLHDLFFHLQRKNRSTNLKWVEETDGTRLGYKFLVRPSILEWAAQRDLASLIYKYHARDRGKHFPADVKNKALSVAAQEGSLSCIPLLIAMGADTEALTPDRHPAPVPRTPLHYATTSQHLTAIELLLDHGADIEAKCCVGFTALRYAFQRMIQPCIQLLLEKGADLSVVDLSVMDLSWGIMLNKETLVRFLLQLGVDPLCPSIFSRSTGCLIAMFNSMSIMKLLLEKGASPTIAILDEGATFKEITFEATTLLHQAALYGIAEAIPLLVSHGAEISTRDGNGFQPLHIAAGAGTEIKLKMPQFQALVSETLRFRPRREVVQALLEGGANISATDRQGRTALDHARRLGDEGILKLLMPDQAGMLGEAGGG